MRISKPLGIFVRMRSTTSLITANTASNEITQEKVASHF